jgi:hypothetical protein
MSETNPSIHGEWNLLHRKRNVRVVVIPTNVGIQQTGKNDAKHRQNKVFKTVALRATPLTLTLSLKGRGNPTEFSAPLRLRERCWAAYLL